MFTKTILVLAAAASGESASLPFVSRFLVADHDPSLLPRLLSYLYSALGQQINTPATLTTCVPAALTWTGGQSPYYLSVLPGGQASGTPLESFGEQTGTSYTWTVNLAAGQAITLALTDSTGKTGES